MKSIIFLSLSILNLFILEGAQACSQSINALFDKNLLVAYAAGEMNVDLSKASSISITNYSQEFTGVDAGSNCSKFSDSQAKISVNYKSNAFTQCSFSVIVKKREQVGITLDMNVPLLDIVTESAVKKCNPILVGTIPQPFPH